MKNKIIAIIIGATIISCISMMNSKVDAEPEHIITAGEEIEAAIRANKEKSISNNRGEKDSQVVVEEEIKVSENVVSVNTIVQEEDISCELLQFPQLSEKDFYYLKKIATCEAGNQSVQTMSLVILTVLNRVKSPQFPNTVYEVITQKFNGVYQFSVCLPGGTWYYMEPNDKSEEALAMVWESLYDYSDGILYFENIGTDEEAANSWFGRNLVFCFKSDDLRFYK